MSLSHRFEMPKSSSFPPDKHLEQSFTARGASALLPPHGPETITQTNHFPEKLLAHLDTHRLPVTYLL